MTMPERLPFLTADEATAFAPELTHAMSVALDDTCRALQVPEAAREAREIIAARIVDLARSGVTDSELLRKRVLHEASGGR